MTDLQTRHVTVNGITLHVTAHGDGPLVLLCHGFPETAYACLLYTSPSPRDS